MLEINTKNRAITQTTKAYNSMFVLPSGERYGLTSEGVFKIGGFTDDGNAVSAIVKSGNSDHGTARGKRIRFIYFGIETTGSLTITVYFDNVQAYEYVVPASADTYKTVKIPIARRHRGSYIAWKIENTDGAFFALRSVKWIPVIK